jgi:hypothetical protein
MESVETAGEFSSSTTKFEMDELEKGKSQNIMLFDDAMQQMSGFGRYQYMLFISMALVNSYGMILMYSFGYLTNPLDYEVM